MILVFDTKSTGTHHAQFNISMLQLLSLAVPGHIIRMHAHKSHVAEIRNDSALAGDRQIEFQSIAISRHFQDKIEIVSIRRFLDELRVLAAALRKVSRGEFCLLVLLVTTSTTMLAARLLAALRLGRIGMVICLHGNVEVLNGWRTRNPLIRCVDTRSLLARRAGRPILYLVFEDAIRRELGNLLPRALETTEVLPHPAHLAEVGLGRKQPLQYPVRIGLVGQASPGKGITPYLATAKLFKQQYGDQVEFYLLGRVFPGDDMARFGCLNGPLSTEALSRDEFCALLDRLHFVFLPLQAEYYRFAASGALLDAITWLKPVIATSMPIVADLFARYGDIGYLCDSVEEMQRALHEVLGKMDQARYAAQAEAMRRVREARLPAALVLEFRAMLLRRFPALTGESAREPADAASVSGQRISG